jgi:uncharacterized protein YjbJ (UPF0337 family)
MRISPGTDLGLGRFSAGNANAYGDAEKFQENVMGSVTDKAKGLANQAGGKLKEGVGKAIGNEQMQAEGLAQQVKGKVQQKVGEAKETVKNAANKIADKANEKL